MVNPADPYEPHWRLSSGPSIGDEELAHQLKEPYACAWRYALGQEVDEIPLIHVTNGVHVPSWLSPDLTTLYDRYLGPKWRTQPFDQRVLQQVGQIPDDELWRAHELSRARLALVVGARTVIANILGLLGVSAPEKM